MQVCTSIQTDNQASTPPLSFYRPDALPAAQPTALKAIANVINWTKLITVLCHAHCPDISLLAKKQMTNANVEKSKKKKHPKTNHTLKLTITKKWNRHRGIKEFLQKLYWHMEERNHVLCERLPIQAVILGWSTAPPWVNGCGHAVSLSIHSHARDFTQWDSRPPAWHYWRAVRACYIHTWGRLTDIGTSRCALATQATTHLARLIGTTLTWWLQLARVQH